MNAKPYPEAVVALARAALAAPLANVLRMNGAPPLENDLVLMDWLEENGMGGVDLRSRNGVELLREIAGEEPSPKTLILVNGVPTWEAIDVHFVTVVRSAVRVRFDTMTNLEGHDAVFRTFAFNRRQSGMKVFRSRIWFFDYQQEVVFLTTKVEGAGDDQNTTLACSEGWADAAPSLGCYHVELAGELVAGR